MCRLANAYFAVSDATFRTLKGLHTYLFQRNGVSVSVPPFRRHLQRQSSPEKEPSVLPMGSGQEACGPLSQLFNLAKYLEFQGQTKSPIPGQMAWLGR